VVQYIGQAIAIYYGGPYGAAAFAGATSYANGGNTFDIASAAFTAYITVAASGYATQGAGTTCADCAQQDGGTLGFGDYIELAAVGVEIVSARSNSKARIRSNAALGPNDGPLQVRIEILRQTFLSSLDNIQTGLDVAGLIPTGINQNPCAHFRRPMDMIFQG
jgi:hypothetical protein